MNSFYEIKIYFFPFEYLAHYACEGTIKMTKLFVK